MISSNGNKIANQFIVNESEFTLFQSYDSVIIKTTFEDGKRKVFLDETYWDYSRTTSRYRNLFLGETTKEIKEKIKSGEYELINLN